MRVLLASTGGHLTELDLLAPRLHPPAEEELWVTFDTPQSRRLLADKQTVFIRSTPPRDWKAIARNTGAARQLLKRYRPAELVTTGAGIALSFVPLFSVYGVHCHYIECSARTDGPSMTGRVLDHVRSGVLYAQDRRFASRRWHYRGSVFDRYAMAEDLLPAKLDTVFITVGSLHFPFTRLLFRLRAIIPRTTHVIVQAGNDARALEWPGAEIRAIMAPDEIERHILSADVSIAHAGIGSALACLEAGRVPLLVPREAQFDEHVDDHQDQIARNLEGRRLAVVSDASGVTLDDLRAASRQRAVLASPRAFHLVTG